MSDLNAALGCSQAEKLNKMIRKRQEIAAIFAAALGGKNLENCIYSRFIAICRNPVSKTVEKFTAAGIEAKKPVYKPLFSYLEYPEDAFPNAVWADRHIISIPIYPAMTRKEIMHIEQFLRRNKDEVYSWAPA